MTKSSFLRGAMILTFAGIVVKILGGVNRILLSRLLGGEGIGLYQMAYPMYILLLSIAGAGIPIAVSIMIAEQAARGNYSGTKRVFHITLVFTLIIAVLCGLGLALGANFLITCGLVRDERAYLPLFVLAPALTVSIITCCFRGYFQGLQLMTPTAISQMLDQFVRVCAMLALASFFLPYGLEKAAAGATFGAVPGAIAGLTAIVWIYYRYTKKQQPCDTGKFVQSSPGAVIKRLIILAVPVAAANMLLPAVASIDLFIVPQRLEAAGYTVHQATALFGYLTGMANGIVQLPAILTMALATSLVPAVSAAYAASRMDIVLQRTNTAMRIANLITMPATFGMAVLAVPISQMLYATPLAGPAICVLSLSVLLVGVQQVTSGLLQGMGHTAIPLYNMVVAALLKIVLSWHLTAIPWLGEVGAAWATNADLAMATVLNLYFAYRYAHYVIQWKYMGKLLAASALTGVTAWFVYHALVFLLGNTVATTAAILTAIIIYLAGLLLVHAVTPDDVQKIPIAGEKLNQIMGKLHH
ncbi:MAG: polysaccharide biosynthesis protein [Megasphaera sp.]|uniref:putative polysaccharide biosynthesis protein n=1 Tax=Megasphaera sueciensis TaxID=349094 RepID=UPI003CFF9860|nr:polysaccharide biosynthesis protein [Megasphaera sp.]MCI1822603.1 polysaccharide biosynthesis protein [Megasphaera sp.]